MKYLTDPTVEALSGTPVHFAVRYGDDETSAKIVEMLLNDK